MVFQLGRRYSALRRRGGSFLFATCVPIDDDMTFPLHFSPVLHCLRFLPYLRFDLILSYNRSGATIHHVRMKLSRKT